jgi:hypothetical protein
MKPTDLEACMKLWKHREFMDKTSELQGMDQEKLKRTVPLMISMLMVRREKDPLVMYERIIGETRRIWTASKKMPIHGGWHHFLVPGILMQILRNNDYNFTEEDLKEAIERGMMIPGGGCGFHGVCGAGSGIGIVLSIVGRSNPLHKDERSRALLGTSEAYKRIARIGGSRCCPLSTYTTLSLGAKILMDMGYKMKLSRLSRRCVFSSINDECHGLTCPYYPRSKIQ